MYEDLTRESLRGRTGGAVTLAVGMAHIFDQALARFSSSGEAAVRGLWKYWYHFAIMFEALFILTTIDAGTRIGRFLLQEIAGKIHPRLGRPNWWPGSIVTTILIVLGWAYFINANSFNAIWLMFGVANQMLAVIALAIVSVYLFNEGRGRYLWVTVCPLVFVMTTTTSAALYLLQMQWNTILAQLHNTARASNTVLINATITASLLVAMLVCTMTIIIAAGVRITGGAVRPAVETEAVVAG